MEVDEQGIRGYWPGRRFRVILDAEDGERGVPQALDRAVDMTVRLISDAFRDYVLEVTESECVLVTCDRLRKTRVTAMVLLDTCFVRRVLPVR